MDFQNHWIEKYRPSELDTIILPANLKTKLDEFKNKGEIPNILFAGINGIGKTSCAKIIAKDILKCDYLYINASDETGIDTIRTKVISFAQTRSLNGGIKLIIFDEGDRLSHESQCSLRNVMEEYAKNTRFIITCNYKHKVIPALQSRCINFEINHSIESVITHCYSILSKENIIVPTEQKPLFIELCRNYFPDIRKIINELQSSSVTGTLDIQSKTASTKFTQAILQKIQDSSDVRKYVIENEQLFQNDYHNLMKNLLQSVYVADLQTLKKRESVLVIAEHMYRHSFVIDPEINFYACTLNLQKVLE